VRNLGRIGFCCACSEQHETRLREGIEPSAEELGGRSNGSKDGAQCGGPRRWRETSQWPALGFRCRGAGGARGRGAGKGEEDGGGDRARGGERGRGSVRGGAQSAVEMVAAA